MENNPRKHLSAHENVDSINELFDSERQILNHGESYRGKKHLHAKSEEITTLIHILTALIGNLNSPYRKLSGSCLLLWLFNLTANFIWDGFESRPKYGYPWLFVRGLLWVTCCVCTWLTVCRAVSWLERGLGELERDRQYSEVFRDISRATEKLSYFLALFAIISGSLQYGMMRRDQATHLVFGHEAHAALGMVLHVLRFISGVHVYYALALFWSIPTCIMLMTGYSMIEFQELTQKRLKNKNTFFSLKHAVEGYKERVQFVKDSSSACMVLLCTLIAFTVISLAVNVYLFLFLHRSLYLYIVHALLPLVLAAYPLVTASWVTKQYHWNLVTVVQAWVDVSDSESDSDNDLSSSEGVTNHNGHFLKRSPADHKGLQAPETPFRVHMPDTGHDSRFVIVRPYKHGNIDKLQSVFSGSARFVGKLKHMRKFRQQKFQFEKYILYLEKVSRSEGFSIGVVLVTWELVSGVLFFLISLIALFLQESIFGKAESTIKI